MSASGLREFVPMGLLGTVLLLCVAASSDMTAGGTAGLTIVPSHSQTAASNQQRPTTPTPAPATQPGQPAPPKPWWQDDATKKDLGLSVKQSKDIDQIYEANRTKLSQLWDDQKKQDAELDKLIREGQVDERVISLKLDLVEASRTQFYKIRMLMLYRMYRILTPEQNKKLQAIQDQMHGRRGGGPH